MIGILSGLGAGLIHVLSGPDHLAALAPLTTNHRRPAWWLGLHWAVGHALGVVAVGLVGFLMRGLLPIELLSSWAQRLLGVLLVGIGIWGLRRALRAHVHPHAHGSQVHSHFHVHWPFPNQAKNHAHGHAILGIGLVHGMAGGSHLLGVLPAIAFPTLLAGAGYLAAYVAGTVLAMTCFVGVVGLAARGFAKAGANQYRACMVGSSTAAILVGMFWLVG